MHYLISDKFRQVAESLKVAIPGLGPYLPDTDSMLESGIDIGELEAAIRTKN